MPNVYVLINGVRLDNSTVAALALIITFEYIEPVLDAVPQIGEVSVTMPPASNQGQWTLALGAAIDAWALTAGVTVLQVILPDFKTTK